MRSIRARLVLWNVLGITLFLAAGGVLTYTVVRARMELEVNRSLTAIAASRSAGIALELGKRFNQGRELDDELDLFGSSMDGPDLFFECLLKDGTRVLASPSLPSGALSVANGAGAEPIIQEVELWNGNRGRVLSMTFALRFRPRPRRPFEAGRPGERGPRFAQRGRPPGGRNPLARAEELDLPRSASLVIARDLSGLDATLRDLQTLLLSTWLASAVGCAALVALIVHLNLRPLRRLRGELERVDEQDLTQRFALDGVPGELTPVITQLNAFLQRIQEAFDREQLLTAHAAHELRTPIAGLRATLELALARPRAVEEHQEAAREALGIARSMQSTVDGVLELARASDASMLSGATRVSVAPSIDELWQTHEPEAQRRGLTLLNRARGEDLDLVTDRDLLGRVLDNLLGNAVSYADPGGEVEVSASRGANGLVLRVANDCSEAPPDVAQRAFDALWRAEAARSRTGQHAGLGLSLCRRIVRVLGGSIDATYSGGRFEVRLEVPDAPLESSQALG